MRLFLLSAVAMFAVGAFASTSALAITPVYLVCLEKAGSGKKYEDRNCSKENAGTGKFELVEVTSFLPANGTSGVSTLTATIAGAELVITCKKDLFTGEIGPKGLSKGEVLYRECSAGNSSGEFTSCQVPNINFKFVDQLVEKSATEVEDEFKPAGGSNLFVNIVIENKEGKSCAEKNTYPVEGTQNAEVEKPSLGCKLLRELTFTPSGSHLTIKGNTATYKGKVSIDLNNDDSWGASIP
jgi:hypothetical protein